MAFYYTRGGKQFGPHSAEEIQAFVAAGRLRANELVWQEGMASWEPLHTVFRNVPPPPPPAAPPLPPAPMQWDEEVYVSRRSRVAYVLLGLFLGGFGIHNFYAGYTGRGVAQLLITLLTGWLIIPLLIVGFWCLIEVIAVSTDAEDRQFS